MGVIACVLAFVGTYAAARKSLGKGIACVMAVGYAYGLFRSHFPDSVGYFLFDVSVLGLYIASIQQIFAPPETRAGAQLKHWTVLLIVLPVILFFVPVQDYLIQLVGLRGNAFFLVFLLLGATLTEFDLSEISLGLAALNIAVLVIAVAEAKFGIDSFLPYNAATDLIFASHDVGSMAAYRIPATFVSAHTYGGQMVLSVPFIIGTWSQPHRKPWHGPLLIAGLLAAVLGVFLSAARVHFVELAVVSVVFSFSTRLRTSQRVVWISVVLIAAYFVSGHERMQRYKTLQDKDQFTERLQSSVNGSFLDALTLYPMGNGLGGGGTSIPYFLYDRLRAPLIIESEYGRIQLELGVFGLALWLTFLFWFFTRPKPVPGDPWFVGKRLAWAVCLMHCLIGIIGTGLLTAIPNSTLMLLMFGWLAAPRPSPTRSPLHADPTSALRLPTHLPQPAELRPR